jgi:DnaJ-class molecular chaperone
MNTDKYFKIFKIKRISDVSKNELKKRFRILAKKYHPDKGGKASNFILIQDAYKYLEKLMNDHIQKQNKKFFNQRYSFYNNGSVYDKKKKRWVKVKGKNIDIKI